MARQQGDKARMGLAHLNKKEIHVQTGEVHAWNKSTVSSIHEAGMRSVHRMFNENYTCPTKAYT